MILLLVIERVLTNSGRERENPIAAIQCDGHTGGTYKVHVTQQRGPPTLLVGKVGRRNVRKHGDVWRMNHLATG